MTGPFDIPEGMPRIEHAAVDEQAQMMRYLAEMAMEDIALLPDTPRGDRFGTLARHKAGQAAREASPENAELSDEEYAKIDIDLNKGL
jgi:hypothetical protein